MQINTSQTGVNTNQYKLDTSQHKSKTSLDHEKQNKNCKAKSKMSSRNICGRLHLPRV